MIDTSKHIQSSIHGALPIHPNIVTLYSTLETSSFQLLILEYVHGLDPLSFLSKTYPYVRAGSLPVDTPPKVELSLPRTRLIASIFTQMCDAVSQCHKISVYHRDIKPQNFLVLDAGRGMNQDVSSEPRVVVKLLDFSLATTAVDSTDLSCGSVPYMSYECRNNLASTYKPRAADIWSLGIVLVNM
ncbi:kinase-like protein [Artomyces pyxidatus]|uniref:Kinase-like protein n=1 Tax=Artomyces pyxidatus TaxID=48021 RepID=A0ACB8T262_9AGAM|nr:kinase-like protein [Artomyces pyxidatus]